MAIIDLSNYDTTLVQSTDSSSGTPDGNVYFDKATGKIEFIPVETLATIDLTSKGGGATDANPLSIQDGIKFEAIYAFENQERKEDEDLRQYDRWTSGTFKFGGAYNFINGRVPLAAADVAIIRGSGWNEYGTDGLVDKIYFGNKGLSNIEASSQPYYQLDTFTTAIDYQKAGQIDEAVLVYDVAGDDNTGVPEIVSIRTYGFNYDRKSTVTDLGIAELGGYSTGFAVNESAHLTTNVESAHPIADVFGGSQAEPWIGMELEELDSAQSEDGFSQGDGKLYTYVLKNPDDGSVCTLDQCVAYLDAIAIQDTDINGHATNTAIGKDVNVWYSYNGAGQIVTQSGMNDSKGLFIEGLVGNDKQRIVQTDDSLAENTYPFYVSVVTNVGAGAVGDTGSWFQTYFDTNYNTDSAVTVQDSSPTDAKTPVGTTIFDSTFRSGNTVVYEFDYDNDTLGGTAGTEKDAVMVVEGDGAVTQAKTLYTINNNSSTINITCNPSTENNV